MRLPHLLVLCALLFGVSLAWRSPSQHDAIDLRDVSALTFHAGKETRARRVSAVPQLSCVGGAACRREFEPQTVQCTNAGYDGASVQWRCEADLDNAVRFGDIEVNCEGFASSDDERVLAGSCGLEYTLEYTGDRRGGFYHSSHDSHARGGSSGGMIGNVLIMLIVGVILYGLYSAIAGPSVARHGTTGYGYPAPGAADCPPSYTAYDTPPQRGWFSGWGGAPRYNGGWWGAPRTGGGWWSGMATGGALGYLFGRRNANNYATYGGTGYAPRYSTGGYSGGFSGSSSGGSSSGSRTATGYGGTRRR